MAARRPRKLTSENRATDTDPSFSPDGTMLAYLAMDRPGYEADKLTVILRSWPGGDIRRLTDDWDRSVERLEWSPDGRTLYVLAEDTGQRGLFALDVATGSVTPLVAQGHVSQAKAVSDAIFYSHDSLAGPADVHVLRGGRHRRLTRLNASKLRGVGLGAVRTVLVRRLERRDRPWVSCSSPPASTRRERIQSPSSSMAARRGAWATTGTIAGTRRSTPAPDTRS